MHKKGAVTWVELDQAAIDAIEAQRIDSGQPREVSGIVDREMARLFGKGEDVSQQVVEQDQRPMVSAATEIECTVINGDPKIEERYEVADTNVGAHQTGQVSTSANISSNFVPIARDGTLFTVDLRNARGLYTVGDKGDEKKFSGYHEALAFLTNMGVAKWRRPNKQGNWGIVSAVDWVAAANDTQ